MFFLVSLLLTYHDLGICENMFPMSDQPLLSSSSILPSSETNHIASFRYIQILFYFPRQLARPANQDICKWKFRRSRRHIDLISGKFDESFMFPPSNLQMDPSKRSSERSPFKDLSNNITTSNYNDINV